MCAHEIGIPPALTGDAVGVFVGEQQMPLMTLAACMRRTVLTDNLGIALALVLFKANKAFLHGVLYPM